MCCFEVYCEKIQDYLPSWMHRSRGPASPWFGSTSQDSLKVRREKRCTVQPSLCRLFTTRCSPCTCSFCRNVMSSSPLVVESQSTKGSLNDGGLPGALVSYNDELPQARGSVRASKTLRRKRDLRAGFKKFVSPRIQSPQCKRLAGHPGHSQWTSR